jgi:hypothetical protein
MMHQMKLPLATQGKAERQGMFYTNNETTIKTFGYTRSGFARVLCALLKKIKLFEQQM